MTNIKYLLSDIARFISNERFPPLPISSCCVDSRLMEKGGLFFALPGAKVDGHAFLGEAAKNGAVAAVVHHSFIGSNAGLILIKVSNPLEALQTLASKILVRRGTRVVAITGSVGKTTTKGFAFQLLRQKYHVTASPGNNNSQIGLPLAILNQPEGQEDLIVLEMGMTEAGQIRKLVEIAPPEVAVITQTALVHAQNFSGIEAIGLAKAEIFSHPSTRLGLLSRDIANYEEICRVGSCQKRSFSLNDNRADFTVKKQSDLFVLCYRNEESVILPFLPVTGEHNTHNFLAAASIARYFKMDWEEIRLAIPHLNLPERRFQIVEKKGILFVDDSYNASEISVKAALKSLPSPSKGGKKIAVIGEMLELGEFSEQCHREVGKYALNYVNQMICFGQECKVIGDLWQSENRSVEWVMTLDEVISKISSLAYPGDVVLLKGSRATGLWKVLNEI